MKKRILALTLALIMAFGLLGTAFAADGGWIGDGPTYISNGDGKAGSYSWPWYVGYPYYHSCYANNTYCASFPNCTHYLYYSCYANNTYCANYPNCTHYLYYPCYSDNTYCANFPYCAHWNWNVTPPTSGTSIPAIPLFPATPTNPATVTNYVPSGAIYNADGTVTVDVYGGAVTYPVTVTYGSYATITVTADAGYALAGLWINGTYYESFGGIISVPVYRPLYITAHFETQKPFFSYKPFPEKEPVEVTPEMITTYADVYSSDPAYNAIQYVSERRLMCGVGGGMFDPNGTFTRAMMATVLWRLEGRPSVLTYDARFKDVPNGLWFTEAVLWASGEGIVEGDDKGAFDPKGAITHGELCSMLARWDSDAYVSAADAWAWAQENNMYQDVAASAKDVATRAEIAQVLMVYFAQVR